MKCRIPQPCDSGLTKRAFLPCSSPHTRIVTCSYGSMGKSLQGVVCAPQAPAGPMVWGEGAKPDVSLHRAGGALGRQWRA